MSVTKKSSFKMFEKAPYELPDAKILTPAIMSGFKEEEKTYGPVFTNRFIKNALSFISQRTREKPSEGISTLDQLAEYLISVSSKYPTPYNAALFAQYKTENELMGQAGAGAQVAVISVSRDVTEKPSIKDRNVEIDGIISKYRQDTVAGGIAQLEMGYYKNSDESIDIIFPNCFLLDGCRQANDEGLLKRRSGKLNCGTMQFLCQFFKLLSGYECDYYLMEFGKPHCIARCFMF